jgi:anti-anti-sigma factor
MTFTAALTQQGRTAVITMVGDMDEPGAALFHDKIEAASTGDLDELVLDMSGLESISSAGLRGLTFCRQKMGDDVRIVLVSPGEAVRQSIEQADLQQSVAFADRVPE